MFSYWYYLIKRRTYCFHNRNTYKRSDWNTVGTIL